MKFSQPIIITIDGISGSGKSFVSDRLATRLKCSVIHGDDIMFEGVGLLQSRMKQIFGNAPGSEDPRVYIDRNLAGEEKIVQRRELFNQTRDYVEEQSIKAIKESDSEICLVEWQSSNLFSELWCDADFRIMVDASIETRERLAKIRGEITDLMPEATLIREKAYRPLLINAQNVNQRIENQGCKKSLFQKIEEVSEQILLL